MIKILLPVVGLSLSSLLCVAQKPKDMPRGAVYQEAESFQTQASDEVRKWVVVDKADDAAAQQAGGAAYLHCVPDTRATRDDKMMKGTNFSDVPGQLAVLTYPVKFKKPGRYYVWVKAYSTGSEDNGIHVGLNGTWPESGQRMQWCEGKKKWTWSGSQRTVEVHCGVPHLIYLDIPKAGKHDIQFSMREDGFRMDSFLLTMDREYNPNQ